MTWTCIKGSAEGSNKKPSGQKAWRVSEFLSAISTSSLAVFYVEQVALNRHVTPHFAAPPIKQEPASHVKPKLRVETVRSPKPRRDTLCVPPAPNPSSAGSAAHLSPVPKHWVPKSTKPKRQRRDTLPCSLPTVSHQPKSLPGQEASNPPAASNHMSNSAILAVLYSTP